MTGAEIIALAKKRGVTAEVFFGKLRIRAESEPDESLVRLLRDNRQAIIDAFLEAAPTAGIVSSRRRSKPSRRCAACRALTLRPRRSGTS
jgi:hypothetical protein